jgi:hypothetical protein
MMVVLPLFGSARGLALGLWIAVTADRGIGLSRKLRASCRFIINYESAYPSIAD